MPHPILSFINVNCAEKSTNYKKSQHKHEDLHHKQHAPTVSVNMNMKAAWLKLNLKSVPSWRLASAHVGSAPRRIITASMTFSTNVGGRP